MAIDITLQKLRSIARDVKGGMTLVRALEKRDLGAQYHVIWERMTKANLQTRPDPAASYTMRVPVSERARACAAMWNDGSVLSEIATAQGVSRQCVSKALHSAEKHGLLTRPTGRTRAEEAKRESLAA